MTNQQAAQILRDHNEWRRDRSDDAPKGMPDSYDSKLLGQAIDAAVKALEQPEPDELERFKADLLRLFPFSDGTNWMAVDKDGELCQFINKPEINLSYWFDDKCHAHLAIINIPDGIDWRDCLIERI